jgi:hypothetical protein
MTPGMCEALVVLPAFAGHDIGKVAKQSRPKGKALKSACQEEPRDLFRHLFYVAGFLPPDGGTKQLSQGGNAELFFGSGAVSLDGFQTQIQIAGNFRRRAALTEQLKNFKFAVTQTFYR